MFSWENGMKNKFPYYQIHQILIDSLGWGAENCLGTSEWEDCCALTIEKINFFIWNQLDELDKNKDSQGCGYLSEQDMNRIWLEHKYPTKKGKNVKKNIK
jgi:hypothetical protein